MRRRLACRAALALAGVIVVSTSPTSLAAQEQGTIAGLVGGYTTSEQIWQPAAEVDEVGGFVIGGFVDAATPLGWLSIHAEGAYAQRGGDVLVDVEGQSVMGGIRTGYLAFAVHARAAVALGPARLHVSAGPSFDTVMRSRLDPMLAQVLEERGTVFGVGAGIGVGAWVTPRMFAEVEARIVEGLGDAYTGDGVSVRNRSRELVVRIGIPIRRQ